MLTKFAIKFTQHFDPVFSISTSPVPIQPFRLLLSYTFAICAVICTKSGDFLSGGTQRHAILAPVCSLSEGKYITHGAESCLF
jgi:hypothetical protein